MSNIDEVVFNLETEFNNFLFNLRKIKDKFDNKDTEKIIEDLQLNYLLQTLKIVNRQLESIWKS
jgi:hypothetical protein